MLPVLAQILGDERVRSWLHATHILLGYDDVRGTYGQKTAGKRPKNGKKISFLIFGIIGYDYLGV